MSAGSPAPKSLESSKWNAPPITSGLALEHEHSEMEHQPGGNGDYKGFVAGCFSGITKLTVGHPFDTIKVRLQTTPKSRFNGPLDCVLQTIRNEGIRGLYRGATPPLVGWMFMDSLMLGSLNVYRRILHENVFTSHNLSGLPYPLRPSESQIQQYSMQLPAFGHAISGVFAGWTVSTIASPIEHVKARLQVQYSVEKSNRFYSGPIDCTKKILRTHGFQGLYHGFFSTIIFRSFFFFWWGSYSLFTSAFKKHTSLSEPAINFWAGGLSAQVFWLSAYPSDVVKQAVMTDSLGGSLGDRVRKYGAYSRNNLLSSRRRWAIFDGTWRDAATAIWRRDGAKGFWRGFVPCFLRAFPANACAIVAFEGVIRMLDR